MIDDGLPPGDLKDHEITRLRAENERLVSGQHNVYAAAREEYRKKIAEQAAENERLLAANRDVMLHWDVLKADYERLRAALRPFAEAADGFDNTRIKNPEEWFAYGGVVSATEVKGAITVGDLRRARAALAAQPAPGAGQRLLKAAHEAAEIAKNPPAPSWWRPIETAPLTGEWIAACYVGGRPFTAFWDANICRWREGVQVFSRHPNYWMPLPPAPKEVE